MNVIPELENASGCVDVPDEAQFRLWAESAMSAASTDGRERELSIRLVDEIESAELNSHYRGKTGATNILSFPVDPGLVLPGDMALPLGDLVICVPVVQQEADSQHKAALAHWAHLTVHGVLHLNGYDHELPAEAEVMEAMEIRVLAGLGYDNPYDER